MFERIILQKRAKKKREKKKRKEKKKREKVFPIPRNADMARKKAYDPRASKKESGQFSQNHGPTSVYINKTCPWSKPSKSLPPVYPHLTKLAAKVISRAKLSCDQIPHEIRGDKLGGTDLPFQATGRPVCAKVDTGRSQTRAATSGEGETGAADWEELRANSSPYTLLRPSRIRTPSSAS